jgi:deoxyribonucleoside regulator
MPLSDPMRHNQLVNAARLHYLRNLTHQQIADKLGLSRVKVTRLLQQAVDEGIVEFRVADPLVDVLELQDALQERFELKSCLVTPSSSSQEQLLDSLGRQAASYLAGVLKPGTTVGLGWGRTLNAMVPYLEDAGHPDVKVVSLTGGLSANSNQPNPYDITTAVAARLGAQPHYLVLPAIVSSERTRDLLLREPGAREVQAQWEQIDTCLLSIGSINPNTGVFHSLDDPTAEADRARTMGAVGDLLARPFDVNGAFLATDYSARTITVDFGLLGKVPQVVGVAGGEPKADAVLGALRTGLLNGLITDEETARTVLNAA